MRFSNWASRTTARKGRLVRKVIRVEPLSDTDPVTIGPYSIRDVLGSGGMGKVFLGISPEGEEVAVKVIHESLAGNEQFRRRFAREVSAAQRITGSRVAKVIAANPAAARPWMATTYVEGKNLQQEMANADDDGDVDFHPLPAAEVMSLAAGVGEALVQIHAAGVTHRDLKPTNILISPDGPKVIDFGIARAIEMSTVTVLGEITGSAGFMSPEQMQGLDVGPPSDVFSLGSVLYFAATGTYAFGAGPAALYRIVHDDPDLSEVADARLRTIITGCLRKDPAQRLSATDLLQLTGSYAAAGSGPTSAVPVVVLATESAQHAVDDAQRPHEAGPAPRPQHGRQRALVAAVAVLVLLLGTGTLVAIRQLGAADASNRTTTTPDPTKGGIPPSVLEPSPEPSPSPSTSETPTAAPTVAPSTARPKPRPTFVPTTAPPTSEQPRETMAPSSTPAKNYSSTGLSLPGDPTARAYFGRLDSVTSAAEDVTFNITENYRQSHGNQCVLTVAVRDVEGAEATVYATGFSVSDWGGAENSPSTDPSADGGTVHQQLISPPKGSGSGSDWTGRALLRVDGEDTYSGGYTLTHLSGGDRDGLWSFNGDTVRCSIY